jgi:hypothetical protein
MKWTSSNRPTDLTAAGDGHLYDLSTRKTREKREKTRHSEQMYRNKSWKTTKTQEKEK